MRAKTDRPDARSAPLKKSLPGPPGRHRAGVSEEKRRKKPRRVEERTVLVLLRGDDRAIRKRPTKGLLSGLFMSFRISPGNLSREEVLEYLKDSTVADKNTLIIVEADLQTDFSYVESLGYRQLRSKRV